MKILLINAYGTPNLKKGYPSLSPLSRKFFLYPSSALEQIATITPKEHNILLIDEALNHVINFNGDYDLVAISCVHTPSAPRAYIIADEFRKRGKTVVLGGWHPSVLPEEAKKHADSVVIGEAEGLWPQLLNDIERKKMKPFYFHEKPIDLNKLKVCIESVLTKSEINNKAGKEV